MLIQWRLNDPAEERHRWTRVHVTYGASQTLCGLTVPEHPYDQNRDKWIPDAAPRCKRCLARLGSELGRNEQSREMEQIYVEQHCDCRDVHANLNLTDATCGCQCHRAQEPQP